ncbi:Protein usf [Hordeum vulgare]|nr:Protein usf [Hordeum vulgare]
MASDAASQFHKIQIQREDTTFDAYVVGKENAPGVVVLQEWWGVDYEVKNHANHISQIGDGYRALIPDLYRGKVALEVAEAQHLMEGLDWPGAIKDIQASVKWLKENGSPKVAFYYLSLFTLQDFLTQIVLLWVMQKILMISNSGRKCDIFCLFAIPTANRLGLSYSFERINMLIEPLAVLNSSVLNQLVSNKRPVKVQVLLSLSFW